MRWNDQGAWIYSAEPTHEALVSPDDFAAVQRQMSASAHRPTVRKVRATRRPYVLSGVVYCSACGRRMQGNESHDTLRYGCTVQGDRQRAERRKGRGADQPWRENRQMTPRPGDRSPALMPSPSKARHPIKSDRYAAPQRTDRLGFLLSGNDAFGHIRSEGPRQNLG